MSIFKQLNKDIKLIHSPLFYFRRTKISGEIFCSYVFRSLGFNASKELAKSLSILDNYGLRFTYF